MRLRLSCAAFALTALAAAASFALDIKEGNFTTADGIKIYYYEAGQGPPVILVHGFTSSAQNNWINPGVFEGLAKNHRVIALDCRNHGKSDKPNPGVPGRSKDVVELMDHLMIPKAHIHGYSMGGAIVGDLLVLIPDRMITAGFGGSGVFDSNARGADAAKAAEPGKAGDATKSETPGAPARGGALSRINFNDPNIPRPGGPPNLDLSKVASIPMLVINGERDSPAQKSAKIEKFVKDHKVVVIPEKDHMTAVRDPMMLKSMAEFIDAHDPK